MGTYKDSLDQVITQLEREQAIIRFGNHRFSIKPEQRIGRGGLGVVYQSADGSDKERTALKLAVALPRVRNFFEERAIPVRCSQSGDEIQLQCTSPSGRKISITGLDQNEAELYRLSQAEQDVGRICAGVPGTISLLESRYFLLRGEQESVLLLGLVMPFIKGKSLSDCLQQEQLSLAEKLSIIAQVGETIKEYRRRNIVHRDIKPENIIVENGKTTVLDYGLAQVLTADYESITTMAGTPEYLAPEVAAGKVHRNTDMYSLGVMAYKVLTGELPYSYTIGEGSNGRTPLFHALYIQGLFHQQKNAEEFSHRVFEAIQAKWFLPPLDRLGRVKRIAESIAGALYGRPEKRDTSLPRVARRYAEIFLPQDTPQASRRLPPERKTMIEEEAPSPLTTTIFDLTEAMRLTEPLVGEEYEA